MTRLIFIGGTLHGEMAPQTDEPRLVSINDGTVYIRRALRHPEAGRPDTEFFVFEPLAHDEAADLSRPYW